MNEASLYLIGLMSLISGTLEFKLRIIYLIKFVKEKANSRLERARDLFEQVVS